MADSDKKADIFPKFMTCSLITRKQDFPVFPWGLAIEPPSFVGADQNVLKSVK